MRVDTLRCYARVVVVQAAAVEPQSPRSVELIFTHAPKSLQSSRHNDSARRHPRPSCRSLKVASGTSLLLKSRSFIDGGSMAAS